MMGCWIRTDCFFDVPMVVIAVPAKRFPLQQLESRTPEFVAGVIQGMILEHRPELSGLIVLGMDFDLLRREWNFLITHPSLPKIAQGANPEKWLLEPLTLKDKHDQSIEGVNQHRLQLEVVLRLGGRPVWSEIEKKWFCECPDCVKAEKIS